MMENVKPKKARWVDQRAWAPACYIDQRGGAVRRVRKGAVLKSMATEPEVAQTDAVLRRMMRHAEPT